MTKCINCECGETCGKCLTQDSFISTIKFAISQAQNDGKPSLASDMERVLNFLPDNPVFAVLEAESSSLSPNMIAMMRETFGVKKWA